MEIALALFPLIGAFLYRMRGGMPPSFARPIDQMLFALPYGAFTYLSIYGYKLDWSVSLFVFGLTTVALCKGHGNSMDLGDQDKTPEYYEFIIKWAKPYIPLYCYDALGLAVSGITYTLPCGLLTLNPLIGLSGLLKAPAYMLAKKGGVGTEGGELLTGAFLYSAVALALS